MNLKQLEYFVSVAELGSFSKAARALNVAQPALSRQVRALETDLREPLLLRNGRGVALTEAGQRLLDHGNSLLQQVAQVREEMGATRGEPVGRITIALPPSISRQLTLPLIDSFRRELPKARLAVKAADREAAAVSVLAPAWARLESVEEVAAAVPVEADLSSAKALARLPSVHAPAPKIIPPFNSTFRSRTMALSRSKSRSSNSAHCSATSPSSPPKYPWLQDKAPPSTR